MKEETYFIVIFLGGVALGTLFFGGLWLTVKTAVKSKIPGLFFTISFIIRTGAAVFGFYYLSAGDWSSLAACLAGFVIMRVIIARSIKSGKETQIKGGTT